MNISNPPKVFTSYSHDSPEHEERVLALSNRLRANGVDATLDQYESAPPQGWPFWMEKQIQEADFVIVICSEAYLRRVERREDSNKGQGVIWEINSIYNLLYSDKLVSDRFVPVLLEGGSTADIPVPLKGFTHYRGDTEAGYDGLYRRLTHQPVASKPALGHFRSLPVKEKNLESLPTAFSLEQLSKTMSNPRYAEDIFKLDRIYDRRSVINKETVIIVVGTTIVTELLDRPAAELLRDQIDQRGGAFPFRRGIVLSDQAWFSEALVLAANPVIAVGGPPANKLSAEFDKWTPSPLSKEGKYAISGAGARTGFFRTNSAGLPQVGLWGHNANATRETVEHYFRNEDGFVEFLKMCWK